MATITMTNNKVIEGNIKCDDKKETFTTELPCLITLKKELPPHCFKPNLFISLYYVLKDIYLIMFGAMVVMVLEQQAPTALYMMSLPIYWTLAAFTMTALFVIGHDCGHDAFSAYSWLNTLVGTFVHTVIIVPYYPWRLSHRAHHKNTNHIDKDEIFTPIREEVMPKIDMADYMPYWGLPVGWMAYFVIGYGPHKRRHLDPFDPLMAPHALGCTLSLLSLFFWVTSALPLYANHLGFSRLLVHYLVPLIISWCLDMALIFMQHSDNGVPWYGDGQWGYVKAQLSTVDRFYGEAWHSLLHNFGSHQIHHLFPKIPHYHIEEATAIFRRIHPNLGFRSHETLLAAFHRLYWMYHYEKVVPKGAQLHIFKGD